MGSDHVIIVAIQGTSDAKNERDKQKGHLSHM